MRTHTRTNDIYQKLDNTHIITHIIALSGNEW